MFKSSNRWRLLGVGIVCAAAGAGGGAIATAGASTDTGSTHPAAGRHLLATRSPARLAHRSGMLRRLARRAVHGDITVETADGWGTVTFDRGTVQSVAGDQVTLAEGTVTASDRTVTVTVPASATVRDDGTPAALSSVAAGQRALIVQLPQRTVVIARTPRAASRS